MPNELRKVGALTHIKDRWSSTLIIRCQSREIGGIEILVYQPLVLLQQVLQPLFFCLLFFVYLVESCEPRFSWHLNEFVFVTASQAFFRAFLFAVKTEQL